LDLQGRDDGDDQSNEKAALSHEDRDGALETLARRGECSVPILEEIEMTEAI
jgi:hypothetical protein